MSQINASTVDTAIYHAGRTHAEHTAWLASLAGDEYRFVHMPRGHLFNLAEVSLLKRFLLTMEMPAALRLQTLETIVGCAFGPVTAEAIEAIEPCCDTGAAIFAELNSVAIEKRTNAFEDGDVFRILAKLNPSLFRALELCQWRGAVP